MKIKKTIKYEKSKIWYKNNIKTIEYKKKPKNMKIKKYA